MNTIHSYSDFDKLQAIINRFYPINCNHVALHRDWIGYVYFIQDKSNRYVLKLYRTFDTNNALHSIGIIAYLSKNDYPVTTIVPTVNDDMYITINTPQGEAVAILYDFIDGEEPTLDTEIEKIGHQIGKLHKFMNQYTNPLVSRGKEYFIDRYITLFHEMGYHQRRIDELEQYGKELWKRMEQLPKGFCHGDLHTGNMLQTESGRYVLFDFDVASYAYPVIDVATLCDSSNYFHLDPLAYDNTLKRFERFYKGYSMECTISDAEIDAIFDFIAIRHYEIQPTIVKCQGLQCISSEFLDKQLEWLFKWKNLCEKKRV